MCLDCTYLHFVMGWSSAEVLLEEQCTTSVREIMESKTGCRALP